MVIALSGASWGSRVSADNGSPISYHNGPVMAGTSDVYVIWYGNWSAATGPNSVDTQTILINFLSEIGGSNNFQTNATYPGANGFPSGGLLFGGIETSSYTHGLELDAAAIQAIVAENISPSRFPYDFNGIYIVVASSDVSSGATGFCTPNAAPHHGTFFLGGAQPVKYAFIGNPARCPSVAAPQFFAPDGSQLATPNGNLAADAMVSTSLHALAATITDPFHTAWFDDLGLENADKCQGSFSHTHTLGNGARVNFTNGLNNYLIQDNWVNNFGGYCGQQNDAPPRADDQTVPVIQGTAKPITLTAVDDNGDPVTFSIVTPPQHGTLTGSGANRTYTPATGFYGADSFTFKANDGTLDSTIATVSITVSSNSVVDGFDPSANGLVRVAVVQPDGKILIGGDFTTLAPNGRLPVTRNYIARLNIDGTIDPTFNPSANSLVKAIALQPDGKIILGGDFSAFTPNGGASINRSYVARFNADGTLDTTLDSHPNGPIHAVAVQADGAIVIGGEFTGFFTNGNPIVTRNRIARLNSDGSLDPNFNPNANSIVDAIVVQPDGRTIIGGQFTTLTPVAGFGPWTRNYIARLNVNGTVDDSFDGNADNSVGSIAIQPDGKVLLGGAFTALGPHDGTLVPRNHLARMNVDDSLDTTFNPSPNGFVRNIVVQPDGKILIGGGFNTLTPNGGATVIHKFIARLNADGTLAPGVDPAPNDQVFAIALQADGKIVVGGVFQQANSFGGQARNRIARLEKDGRVDQTLNLNAVGGAVYTTAVQADGKILIGGEFGGILGVGRNRIARLNTDGTLDTTFNPNANGAVMAMAVQPDDKIVVGGHFTSFSPVGGGTITRNHIARLNADGTVDTTFDPNASTDVYTLALQGDGKILLGGTFVQLIPPGQGSVNRNRIARLHPDGRVDLTFNPSANDIVQNITLGTDGKILAGGAFTTLAPNNGALVMRNYLARLNNDGTVDLPFDPNPSDKVSVIAVQADGKIVVGGYFNTFAPNGGLTITRPHLARLNTDGNVDPSFSASAGSIVTSLALQTDGKILANGEFTSNEASPVTHRWFVRLNSDGSVDPAIDATTSDVVFAIGLQSDGKILLGGSFDSVSGQGRNLFARLANDTPAIQNLAVTSSTVTWTRSGAAPPVSRVVFERSTNGSSYAFLGNGARVGTSSDFTLTGQTLPTQQNVNIRARGFYGGGGPNGSESSVTESVRNVFLPAALHLALAQQPTNAPENGTITPAVTVQVLNAANSLVNSSTAVTVSIGTNPASGTLSGTKTVAAINGTATFNNLAIDKLGAGYTLSASGTDLTGAVSNPFNITVNAPSNISAANGSGQSAAINSAFTNSLQARVTDVNGNPVSGVVVTFTAPAIGASIMFANSTTQTNATTDANGLATASSFMANSNAGLYAISASINSGAASAAFSLTNLKANQTINVTTHAPAGANYNTQFNVVASSSSGLPISYGSSGGCTNNGASFTMTSGSDVCTVKYDQPGDANHNAASTTTETVTAQKATQTITFDAVADKVFGDADFVVNASSTAGLNVNLAASGNCSSSGSTIHVNGAGSCTIKASQVGNSDYHAAPDVTRSFGIAKAAQTISFDDLANKTFGDADFTISANAASGLAVSFAANGQCIVAGNSVHLTGAGSCTVTASQSGDANYNPASDVQRSFQIAKAAQTISFDALADSTFGAADFLISASASSGLPVSFAGAGQCSISGATVHLNGAGVCSITASQAGDANRDAAPDVVRSFQIGKAAQTVSFDALADSTFGAADFLISASASSGLPVSFAGAGQCSISGATVHLSGAGVCSITASQAGDANRDAAPDVIRSFQISKAATTTQLSCSVNGGQVFAATVTSTAGTPNGTVTFKNDGVTIAACDALNLSSGAATCVIAALPAGTHTFTVEYSGDANFNGSTDVFVGGQAGSTFEFSQATYNVGERGSITISVKRAGDVSSPATVDYSTDDNTIASVAVPCGLVTGFALERCDYTRAAGTLQFAANETEKSFVVLVNDDSYTEGLETTSLKLSNPTSGVALGSQATATLQIIDDLAEPLTNAVDDNATFVRQHYHDFLNREPDSDGFSFWTKNIASCDREECPQLKRVDTSAAFFLSIEFQETGYLVQRFYKAAYGDAIGASNLGTAHQISVPVVRLREFLHDTQEIGQGVVVAQTGWREQLENRKQSFARDFISRDRFKNAYADSLNAEQFVTRINANAGGVLTSAEMEQLEGVFGGPNASSADDAKRAQVLRSLAENAGLQQSEFNRAFVLMQYFGYLRRNPDDAQDTDYTGYDFWVRKLEQFGGNYINAEMVKAFITSNEYRQRFGQ
jgi:uncharacterized delta-60 repeat protein